jgi:glucose/arabinose dehydrogenase
LISIPKPLSKKRILPVALFILAVFVLPHKLPVLGASSSIHYGVETAFPSLTFSNPVGIYPANDGTNRLFVVQQNGLICVFNNSRTVTSSTVFLDIRDRVLFGGEEGLLGLAFHPTLAQNKYFYVDYVADSPPRTVIARYSVSTGNPDEADKNSEVILLEVSQPFSNHKGGQIAFGPDGFLYIALGDGGSAGDPYGNAQNLTTLLGKILRIDVDSTSLGRQYGIPADNPFAGNSNGYREEIYAYGLRNPWRFSFDLQTGWLWAGDVGQDRREEVDIIQKGKNYGWNITEGTLCYSPPSGCNATGLELPIWEYGHDVGNAVTGGFVYRGSLLKELVGAYIYGDFGSGRIWALWYSGTNVASNTELIDTGLSIASFGIDNSNSLYFCAFDGKIYRLIHVPNIENVTQQPQGSIVPPDTEVEIQATVTDPTSTVKRVVLNYTTDNHVWTELNMTNSRGDLYIVKIPGFAYGINVTYAIFAEDNRNNSLNTAEIGYIFQYQAIPEFASPLILTILMTLGLAAALTWKKSRAKQLVTLQHS